MNEDEERSLVHALEEALETTEDIVNNELRAFAIAAHPAVVEWANDYWAFAFGEGKAEGIAGEDI